MFLTGKGRRSGSRRPVEGYSRMPQHLFAGLRHNRMDSPTGEPILR
jgi:hypothetical protein